MFDAISGRCYSWPLSVQGIRFQPKRANPDDEHSEEDFAHWKNTAGTRSWRRRRRRRRRWWRRQRQRRRRRRRRRRRTTLLGMERFGIEPWALPFSSRIRGKSHSKSQRVKSRKRKKSEAPKLILSRNKKVNSILPPYPGWCKIILNEQPNNSS